MKKLFSLLTLALLTMSAWAATNTYSYTFGSKTFSADGTVKLNDVEWTLATEATDGGYYGYDNTKGQQFGSGSKPCSEVTLSTSGISGTITKVTVNASTGSQATATMEVTVGGDSFISTDLTSTATNYSGTGSATGEVVIKLEQPNTSKALYIKSIEIVYEGEAVSVAAPVFNPNGGKFSVNSLEVTVTCADSPCDIYVFEGDQVDWTANYWYYNAPFYVTGTKTYTAIAYKGSVESAPTTVTFTKVDPAPAYTFLPAEYDAVDGKAFSIEKDGVTFACTQGTITDEQFRIFKNQTATFTAGEGVADIVKIEFTCTTEGTNKYGPGCFALQGENGTYSYEGYIGTWTGKTNSVAFKAITDQVRATQIVFTLDDGTTVYVLAPTLPESCEFEDSKTIEIINNEEGSTIMYAINDGDYTEYSVPFTINETTTVKAYAEYEGIRSNVVSATYTLIEAEAITTLAQVNALGNNAEFTFQGNAVVTVQKNGYLWLRDASGYGLIYGSINGATDVTFPVGTVLNPGWTAKTKIYSGLMEYVNSDNVSASGYTNPELAAIQTITELDTTMVNAYVQVLNVKSFDISGQNVTATLTDGTTMVMYNTFNESLPTTEGNFTVEGVVSTHNGLQLIIISVKGYVPEEHNVYSIPEAIAVGPNDTFTMYDDIVVTFNHASTKRMWIRDTQGNSGLIYGVENTNDIVNGTVLSDGWTGKNYTRYGVPQFQNTEDVVASGDTREAAPFERQSIDSTNVNEYVIFKGINMLPDASEAKRFYNAADSTVLFNTFGITIPTIEDGKTYDVTGVVTLYNNVAQLYITEVVEAAAPAGLRGDVNDDTFVNISDVTTLIDYLLNPATVINEENANVNLDEAINISDVTVLIDFLLSGTWPNK